MRLDTSQQLRLQQQMRLSPRMIQAMEILQLPILALQERIEAEMESNPVLELVESVDEAAAAEPREEEDIPAERAMVVDGDGGKSEDFQRLAQFEDEFGGEFPRSDSPPRAPAPPAGERDRKLDAMANAPAPAQSLDEHLLDQWTFVEAAESVKQAGRAVIENIDEDGYLRTPLEELAKKTQPPTPMEKLVAALTLIQTLDPPGVGARDLKECLLIQLAAEAEAGADVALEQEIVADYLREVEANHLPHVAKRTGRTVEDVIKAVRNLGRLNLRPGSLVGSRGVPAVLPDAVVDVDDDGQVVVNMPRGNLPHLVISRSYRKLAEDSKTDKPAKRFLQSNMRTAEWLIAAIQQRRQTVGRVVEEVFAAQRAFLDGGPSALKPLPMADVAGKVGVHVATVSRAVAGKYVQTPRGIFPLRMFFSGGTTTAEGQDVAWDAVKAKLQEVVSAEDKSKPLNDDEIVAKLIESGLTIARRTVAKYRDLLSIPPARKRKQY